MEVITADGRDGSEQQAPVECSKPDEGCLESKCCKASGMLCYEKVADGWAQCRVSCNPGPDPADQDYGNWSCKELGPRTPGPTPSPNYAIVPAKWVQEKCSGPGEDCESTMCCQETGKQCYRKSKGWASCKVECFPGPDVTDEDSHPWNCTELGMRTPGPASAWGVLGDWVEEKCAKKYENCIDSRCCQEHGTACYKKSDAWAMCMESCAPGPLLTDRDNQKWNCTQLGGRTPGLPQTGDPLEAADWVAEECSEPENANCKETMCCMNATYQCYAKNDTWASCRRSCDSSKKDEDGSKWTCDKLGSRTPRDWQSPSLYCFHVIRVFSYEADIVRTEVSLRGGVGIFACELYDIFASDGTTHLGQGPLGTVRTHHFTAAPVTRSVDGTAGNTALFMNVWEAVKWIGRYRHCDWTIKADPDAVVFPDRLRRVLSWHDDKNWAKGQYIVDCVKPYMSPMMFGALEVISEKAMTNYFNREGECKSGYQYGEDRWLNDCLNRLGTHGTQVLDLVGDKVCQGANCYDGKAAYHFFKDVGSWRTCFEQATR